MTLPKEEILHRLKTSKEINTVEATKNWQEAFTLYNETRGTKMNPFINCSKCYQIVLDFIQNTEGAEE